MKGRGRKKRRNRVQIEEVQTREEQNQSQDVLLRRRNSGERVLLRRRNSDEHVFSGERVLLWRARFVLAVEVRRASVAGVEVWREDPFEHEPGFWRWRTGHVKLRK